MELSPKSTVLPAPEEVFLGPVAVFLGRRFFAITLLGIAGIPVESFSYKNVPPQAFCPVKYA
ncbi:hypothetical protein FHS21_003025 [Phyllobacterium trifolii]|uniref:Uncharacterized protein n=1 Tax=Phyllobacterium trifolii TaxID=300193 RepID=A0A839UCE2_9HYPH|nr:hypothetical protein [Phyllobacterium trifolii]MBB3146610.1 hypothetical protein [Phyllobacterium trifolii]